MNTFHSWQVGNPRVELTLSELQDMAARQQQQIENQQQMLVAKVSYKYRVMEALFKMCVPQQSFRLEFIYFARMLTQCLFLCVIPSVLMDAA